MIWIYNSHLGPLIVHRLGESGVSGFEYKKSLSSRFPYKSLATFLDLYDILG